MIRYYAARASEYDDWYERRGRYSHGERNDRIWHAEMAEAAEWLEGLPLEGQIVELAAGTGWWSPILARKGSLRLYDTSPEVLSIARKRLQEVGLQAVAEIRDAWSEPDRTVDRLFTGFWLSHVARERLAEFTGLAARWLRPGGLYAFIDSRFDADSGATNHRAPEEEVQVRRLDDGSTYRVRKIHYSPAELEAVLASCGFRDIAVRMTERFFVLGSASR